MSKSIKIPDTLTRIEVTVNGRTYSYKGGATVTVPDEVAALLEGNEAGKTKGVRASALDEALAGITADAATLDADVKSLKGRVTALDAADTGEVDLLKGRVTALDDAETGEIALLKGRVSALEDDDTTPAAGG